MDDTKLLASQVPVNVPVPGYAGYPTTASCSKDANSDQKQSFPCVPNSKFPEAINIQIPFSEGPYWFCGYRMQGDRKLRPVERNPNAFAAQIGFLVHPVPSRIRMDCLQ